MISGVYGVLHRPTGQWYVGRASNVGARWRQHRRKAAQGSTLLFHQALRGHRAEEFTWMVLQPCSPVEAIAVEERWIAKLAAFERGFNCTQGGEWTPGDYANIRAKMVAARRARVDRPFLGRKHSAESLALIKAAASARGPEWRAKLAQRATGRRFTAERIARMRASHAGLHRGCENPFFGRRHSEATRQKIAEAHRGRIKTTPEKEARIVELRVAGMNLRQIAKAVRVSKTTASKVLARRIAHARVNQDMQLAAMGRLRPAAA